MLRYSSKTTSRCKNLRIFSLPSHLTTLFDREPYTTRNENPQTEPSPTNRRLGSLQTPSQISSNHRLAEHRNGFGLAGLEIYPESCTDHHDGFAADADKVYRILRNFNSKGSKLETALQESGVVLRPGLTESVLARCGDAGNLAYSFFVWVSKQPGYRHSFEVYTAMINVLGKMKQYGTIWALIEEMRKDSPELLTSQVFVILMRRFANARMVNKAIEVFDEMPKYGCEADEDAFGCLLDALCKNGSVKEAAEVFKERKNRLTPTLKYFTSLLYGWCREGKLDEAKQVLVQMRESGFEPDTVVFNNLISGYARARKMADAFDLLKEMRRKGCQPNAASYTILIKALCAQEKTEEAMRVFVEMERSGVEPDVVTYSTLISGFCKWGKIEKGYELLDSLIERGLNPSQLTFMHIMFAHENNEELEECKVLMERMQKIGCIPDLNIYNIVIRLAFKLGEVKEAVDVWNQMEASGFSPGLDTFVIMIHGFVGQDCLFEGCEYFREMVGRGLLPAPQYGIMKDLFNSLLRAKKLEMAVDVWIYIITKGCELNVSAWTIWIHALISNGYVKEARSYCLEMMEADLMPQPVTYAKFMKGLDKLSNRVIATEITEKVMKMAADTQITFKSYIRKGEREMEEKVEAMKDRKKRRARRRGRANLF